MQRGIFPYEITDMSKSIISNEKCCFRCGTTQNLHRHHIYAGRFRNKSEKYGLWVYLCAEHHIGDTGVHSAKGTQYWNYLKKIGQSHFETIYGRELFMAEFKHNWKVEEL